MRSLNEYKASKIRAYHGSNKQFKKFSIKNNDIGWFTDSYDYAASQGAYVTEFILEPTKILNSSSITNITNDEIKDSLLEYKPSLSIDKLDKILSRVHKNINSYKKGKIGGADIFSGMGGVNILRILGFDMEQVENPYDKKSIFYLVYDEQIINAI